MRLRWGPPRASWWRRAARRRGGGGGASGGQRAAAGGPRRAVRAPTRSPRRRRETPRRRRRRTRRGGGGDAAEPPARWTRAAALGRGGRRDQGGAARGRCERHAAPYPDGGAPDDDRADGEPRTRRTRNIRKISLWYPKLVVGRAAGAPRTLQGHPVGPTWTSRRCPRAPARARKRGCRSRFPRTGADSWRRVSQSRRDVSQTEAREQPADHRVRRGAYYGGVTPSAVPDAVSVKDVKDVKDGTRAPNENNALFGARRARHRHDRRRGHERAFAVSSLWIDASPAAARRRAARRGARVRDAERASRERQGEATRRGEGRRVANPKPARAVRSRRAAEKALAGRPGAALCTQRARQRGVALESEARRAVDVDRRARARRAVTPRATGGAPGRRGWRDERASGQARRCGWRRRRRRRGAATREPSGTTTRKTESETKKAQSAWGVPCTTPSSLSALEPRLRRREQKTKTRLVAVVVDVAGFLGTRAGGGGGGENAGGGGEDNVTAASPRTRGTSARGAPAAAAAEAEAGGGSRGRGRGGGRG